jgi:hypothetical protein
LTVKSLFFLQAPPAPTGSAPTADDRATAFRPVDGGQQLQSGEQLLVIAYMAFWLCVVVLVIFSYRKQRGLDHRIALLEGALAKERLKASPPKEGAD